MPNAGTVPQDACVELYSGWATTYGGGCLYGRVHRGKPQPLPVEGDIWIHKLEQTFDDLDLHALDMAHVRLTGFPESTFFTADEHGFLKVRLPCGMPSGVVSIEVKLEMASYVQVSATTKVQVWKLPTPPVGVISDIDDTLTLTQVTDRPKMLRNIFFHNTYDVEIFDGAAEAMTAIAGRGADLFPTLPVFYLSGSPWALHSRISDAFDRVGLPHGATILRRYSQESLNPFHFKHPHLLEIVDTNPGYKWILFGDSGEKDPEVYHTLMEERPGAIQAVFIHRVTKEDPKDPRFEDFTVFDRWSEVSDAIRQHKLGLCSDEARRQA